MPRGGQESKQICPALQTLWCLLTRLRFELLKTTVIALRGYRGGKKVDNTADNIGEIDLNLEPRLYIASKKRREKKTFSDFYIYILYSLCPGGTEGLTVWSGNKKNCSTK